MLLEVSVSCISHHVELHWHAHVGGHCSTRPCQCAPRALPHCSPGGAACCCCCCCCCCAANRLPLNPSFFSSPSASSSVCRSCKERGGWGRGGPAFARRPPSVQRSPARGLAPHAFTGSAGSRKQQGEQQGAAGGSRAAGGTCTHQAAESVQLVAGARHRLAQRCLGAHGVAVAARDLGVLLRQQALLLLLVGRDDGGRRAEAG